MIYLLQGHPHLISEERKKADQLPGNSFGNCRVWACDIVVLIVAVQRFYGCCLLPPKRVKDYFSLVSFHICSHEANFSVYVFIHMFSLVTCLFKSSMTERQMSKTTNTVNTSQIEEGESVNNAIERELVIC